MPQQTVPVTPALLRWAREEAGLSLEAAAARAKIKPQRKTKTVEELQPGQRLDAWEQGRGTPTLTQLEGLAKVYRRPLVTFFLPEPPAKKESFIDFRQASVDLPAKDSPEFSALKRRIILLQRELLALANEEQRPTLRFVGSASLAQSASTIASDIRTKLGISFQDQIAVKKKEDLLKYLREAAHDAGIFILLLGDLGNHHSNVDPQEFRGIAIADPVAPVIVINKNDAKAAMIFTLVHELAHLWLGFNGISNLDFFSVTHSPHKKEERLCNQVAAEFLMPDEEFRSAREQHGEKSLQDLVEALAKQFKVSGAAAARRLKDLNYIPDDDYNKLLAFYKERWRKIKEKQASSKGGANRNVTDAFQLGKKTIQAFVSAADNGQMSWQDASRILNIPVSRFDKVLR